MFGWWILLFAGGSGLQPGLAACGRTRAEPAATATTSSDEGDATTRAEPAAVGITSAEAC